MLEWILSLIGMGKSAKKRKRRLEKLRRQQEKLENMAIENDFVVKDNSDCVAYVYSLQDPEYQVVKGLLEQAGWKETFKEFKTLEDVKPIVTNESYYAWDEMWVGAKNDTSNFPVPTEDDYGFDKGAIKDLEERGHDADAIWLLLKSHYEPVVGFAVACVNANVKKGNISEYTIIMSYKKILKEKKTKEILSPFKPGDIIAADGSKTMKTRYEYPFLFVYGGNNEMAIDYNREWKRYDGTPGNVDFKNGLDVDPEGWKITWNCIDLASLRAATEDEAKELQEAIDKTGLTKYSTECKVWYKSSQSQTS